MLTSRQRARLRAHAHKLSPILHIGKSGLTAAVTQQAHEALLAHELIKVTVQPHAGMDATTVADELAQSTRACVVETRGRRFILYRPHPDEPRLDPNSPGSPGN